MGDKFYKVRVFGIRDLGYVYTVSAPTKKAAYELAKLEYRKETGDVILRIEDVVHTSVKTT